MPMTDRASAVEGIVASLDISPTDFKIARDRYLAVGRWLNEGVYESGDSVDIYLQGSFRLGTVVRPFMNGQDGDYDIDQVCEISGDSIGARRLKHDVGDRLKAYAEYARMLDAEGRRCWTLEYASSDGRPGFHLDVLPSCPADTTSTQIRITHKDGDTYSWRFSNPKGYYGWFSEKNAMNAQYEQQQMEAIFASNRNAYASVSDVPRELARTNLQRAIQVMKRHRDVCFSGRDGAPISIIITTICAHTYGGLDVLGTVRDFADYVALRFATVTRGGVLQPDDILDYQDGRWVIKNPAHAQENFAERWAENPELAQNFVAWVYQLRRDVDAFRNSGYPPDLGLTAPGSQSGETPFGEALLARFSSGAIGSSQAFLDLIHQGIEAKIPWADVRKVAVRNVDLEETGESKDVAWVNFYQVKIHSGAGLTDEDRSRIRSILRNHSDSPSFVFCCDALLGSATASMLRACIAERERSSGDGEDVLRWPITRLVARQIASTGGVMVPARESAFYGRGAS